MRFRSFIFFVWALVCAARPSPLLAGPEAISPFVQKYCIDCHDGDSKKGNLDLTSLKFDLRDHGNFTKWLLVHDKVESGDMPPKKRARPDAGDLSAFLKSLSSALTVADEERIAQDGRATERRLNRYEYENTLRDLLSLPYLEVKSFLPEDSEAYGFNKVGDALAVSHVQMARYLAAADFALHSALAPQATPPREKAIRYYAWDQKSFFSKIHLNGPVNRRTFPLSGWDLQRALMAKNVPEENLGVKPKAEPIPDRPPQSAIALVVSTYEPTEIRFSEFRAPVSGKYKLKFSAYSIWMSSNFSRVTAGRRPEPVTLYAETPPRGLRKLGSFDVNPEPTESEMTVWLLAGETIRPDAARFFRSRPPSFINPLATSEGMPGLAFQWMEVDGPIIDQWPPAGHQLLFGNLSIVSRPLSPREKKFRPPSGVEVISKNPESDARRLLRRFMQQAYRRPVLDEDVARFEGVVQDALKSGYQFTDAMIAGYTAVLCSPGFIYLQEQPGKLGDAALAERLSYFLWNSCPDRELRQLADRNELHRADILDAQVERLLNDPRSRQFVDAFLDYWLDLRLIGGNAPDAELYPDYQLDDLLTESMTSETQLFFSELVRRNASVTNLVESDFTVLNERLAKLYDIRDVHGVALRPVELTEGSVRGGLLTQASVLRVTANGTTTSPVKRGAWIMARVLGKPPPPPPASVPALEPDTRGATTIREQLAKHRSEETCAMCHRNIDPAGFALESFDVMGAFREQYRVSGSGPSVKGVGHNGLPFEFCLGPRVDSSGQLPDGRTFRDVRQLKQDLLDDKAQLARNLARQLTIFATGAPIGFSDRPKIEKMLAQTKDSDYGVRSLIHQVVKSDLFLKK